MSRHNIFILIRSLLLGGLGALIASFLAFPAPMLTGSALVVLIASLLRVELLVPPLFREAAFLAIGLTVGNSISQDALSGVLRWPLSFLIMSLSLIATTFLARWLLVRFWKHDSTTAAIAALPGHLSYSIAMSATIGANVAAVSVIQSIRVAALVFLVPVAIDTFDVHGLAAAPNAQLAMTLPLLLVVTLGAIAAGAGLRYLKVSASFLIGGIVTAGLFRLSGVGEGAIPNWVNWPAFIVIGTLIGTRFSGTPMADLRRFAVAGLVVTLAAVTCAAIAALAASLLLDLPLTTMLVAYTPGAAETTTAIAVAFDLDPTLVAAHHVFRLMFLIVLAPLVLRSLRTA